MAATFPKCSAAKEYRKAVTITKASSGWLTGRRANLDTDVPIEFLSVDRAPLVVREKNVLA